MGAVRVPAEVYFRAGPFAVTRFYEGMPGLAKFHRSYVVTHVPTGRTIGTPAYRFRSVRRAREAIEAIAPICDWRRVRNCSVPKIARDLVPLVLGCAEDA